MTDINWIDARKEKPDYNVSVLVFIPEEDDHCTVGMWDISRKWVLLDEYRIPKSEVTYWAEMVQLPDDKTFKKIKEVSDKMDTTTDHIRNLQIENYKLNELCKQQHELLERTCSGIEWDIDNKPESVDKADYDHLEEVKQAIEAFNKLMK